MKKSYSNKLKPFQIAFVGNTSFSLYKFRLGVMKSFVKEAFNVYAIAPEDEYSNFFEQEGIKYIPISIDNKGTNVFKDIKLMFDLLKVYQKNHFDFIFHYTIKPNIYGSISSRILKIPSIAITTGLGYSFAKKNFLNFIVKKLYKFALNKVEEVWFLNLHDQQYFIQNKIITSNKVFLLPGEGIDSNYYSPRPKSEKEDRFIFLMLSRLIEGKGIPEYVKAAEILRRKGFNVECRLLGKQEKNDSQSISIDKVYKWHQEGIINYLGESIDVRDFIANSDCVVLPSYYMEGIPRCLMEAMSMSKPIITTDNVGCNELIVDDVNGFICQSKDVYDLADKMEKIYKTDLSKRISMGENGRKIIIKQFEESIIINEYHKKIKTYLSFKNVKCINSTSQNENRRNFKIDKKSSTIKSRF
jgi:glycosyltransferase involved in cell wall biosynthesis